MMAGQLRARLASNASFRFSASIAQTPIKPLAPDVLQMLQATRSRERQDPSVVRLRHPLLPGRTAGPARAQGDPRRAHAAAAAFADRARSDVGVSAQHFVPRARSTVGEVVNESRYARCHQ